MNEEVVNPSSVFFPSCAGETGGGQNGEPGTVDRDEERVSFLAPAPRVYRKPAVHFAMTRNALDMIGMHYQEDILAFAEEHGVNAEYFHNDRDGRLFQNVHESLAGHFPKWMLQLSPTEEVQRKYSADPGYYTRLRHLGFIHRELLEDLFEFLETTFPLDEDPKPSPYCYNSSARDDLISLNLPSPTEKNVYINVSLPEEAVGDVAQFTRECIRRSINISLAPSSR